MSAPIAIGLAFLLGSLPASRLVERLWSVDLRSSGTRNAGAGNATRSAGLAAGVTLAVLDGLKGLISVLVAQEFGLPVAAVAMTGLAAVAGNNWPLWRSDRGGRGLATSVGVIVGVAPALIVWPGIWSVIGWKIGGSLAGFFGWGLLPVYAALFDGSPTLVLLAAGLAVMMVARRAQGNAGCRRAGLVARVVFDDDSRPVNNPSRPLAAGRMGVWATVLLFIGFPAYAVVARTQATKVDVHGWAIGILVAAVATEFGAKFAFGELFREGVIRSGRSLTRQAGFRAALVGTGVARLIPVGGAVTPLAMAWAVGDEEKGTVGAALRATVLNYGALSFATGGGLLWVTVRFPPSRAPTTLLVIGAVLLVVGAVVIGFSTRLRVLVPLVPKRFRPRLEAALVDHDLTWRSWGLLTSRVVLEAATLGLTLIAFGLALAPSQVVAAFGASQLVGGLPGTPGGLGVTEAGLGGALIIFGIPAATVAAPVLAFRLISYWLPAIGGVAAGGSSFLRRHSERARSG